MFLSPALFSFDVHGFSRASLPDTTASAVTVRPPRGLAPAVGDASVEAWATCGMTACASTSLVCSCSRLGQNIQASYEAVASRGVAVKVVASVVVIDVLGIVEVLAVDVIVVIVRSIILFNAYGCGRQTARIVGRVAI